MQFSCTRLPPEGNNCINADFPSSKLTHTHPKEMSDDTVSLTYYMQGRTDICSIINDQTRTDDQLKFISLNFLSKFHIIELISFRTNGKWY